MLVHSVSHAKFAVNQHSGGAEKSYYCEKIHIIMQILFTTFYGLDDR